jgi:large subunit ribosomal protein L33
MAKKGKRTLLLLVCNECKTQNYITNKNKINTPDKLEVKKFCPVCRTRTTHTERTKLK